MTRKIFCNKCDQEMSETYVNVFGFHLCYICYMKLRKYLRTKEREMK